MEKEEWTSDFAAYLRDDERSEKTIDTYIYNIKIFFSQYGEISKKNMLDFKKQQIEKWKPATANNRVIALNQFCKFIGHPECCVKGVKIQKKSSVENVITVDEYKKLLCGLKEDGNEKGYWMIQLLSKTGARVSEFIQLTKDGLDRGYCEMWTKGKIRRIYIPKVLIQESKAYFSEYFKHVDTELLFTNRWGEPYTSRGVAANIKRWADRYGIRPEVMHPHSFRHLYAIQFLKENNNISLLADLMGHSSVDTTSIYLKLSREEQMEQLNQASNW